MKRMSVNPLAEYEMLIEFKGISKCYKSFLMDAEMLDGRFKDENEKAFQFIEFDGYGEPVFIRVNFRDKLSSTLSNTYKSTIQAISNQLSSVTTEKKRKSTVTNLLDSLEYLYN